MAKKKTIGPDTPAEQPAAPARRATSSSPRKRAAVRRDTDAASAADATPIAEPIDSAADMSVGAGSSDSAAARQPSYDEIAEAAYHRYLQRGGQHGQDFDDWVEAERSLRRG
jgi:hypothetical protein